MVILVSIAPLVDRTLASLVDRTQNISTTGMVILVGEYISMLDRTSLVDRTSVSVQQEW